LQDVIDKALALEVSFFQCFFVLKSTGRLLTITEAERQAFLTLRRTYFNHLYVHGSYWINLSGLVKISHRALFRELELAKSLEFTHLVLHAGSAKGGKSKSDGIAALAHALNTLLKHEHTIKIMLENTAHGGLSVGGDLYDFVDLLHKLEHPEKITFCIDTAHAYSYGYNLVDDEQRESFVQLLDDTIGIDRISLIHLNDTNEKLGSKVDRHQAIGAGRIGEQALKAFCVHPKLVTIPVLLELPVLVEAQERQQLALVRGWHS
jgi:deoxyribonuclease-4